MMILLPLARAILLALSNMLLQPVSKEVAEGKGPWDRGIRGEVFSQANLHYRYPTPDL